MNYQVVARSKVERHCHHTITLNPGIDKECVLGIVACNETRMVSTNAFRLFAIATGSAGAKTKTALFA